MGPHLYQPGGPFRPSRHPSVAGRELELRALADAVRRVVAATVTHVASAEETAGLAAEVRRLAERLEQLVPDPVPARFVISQDPTGTPHDANPFDVVTGVANPLAVPVEMSVEPPVAVGVATFSTAYEGPPGCVHGAVLAGVFDMVLSAANHQHGRAGPTANLTINYRRPTLLHRSCRFEGWVAEVDGRKTHSAGRLVQDDQVTVEATGLFLQMPHDAIGRLRDLAVGD